VFSAREFRKISSCQIFTHSLIRMLISKKGYWSQLIKIDIPLVLVKNILEKLKSRRNMIIS
jgi:hypothetical protein